MKWENELKFRWMMKSSDFGETVESSVYRGRSRLETEIFVYGN